MPFRLVVWDFDGTLVDSLAASLEIFNRHAEELRYRPIDDPDAVRSMSTREFMRHHGISVWRLPRLVRLFHAAAAEGIEQLKLYPGLIETLAAFRDGGVRLGILSSNRDDNIRRCLRVNGRKSFLLSLSAIRVYSVKERRYSRISSSGTGRLFREALYVGDDEVRDIDAAREARVASAAVTWGFHTEHLLRASHPDHVIDNPAARCELVQGRPARAVAR